MSSFSSREKSSFWKKFKQNIQVLWTKTKIHVLSTEFQCPVCYEIYAKEDGYKTQTCCQQRLCQDCLYQYIKITINTKNIKQTSLICPFPNCSEQLSFTSLQTTFSTPTSENKKLVYDVNMFLTKKYLIQMASFQFCPHCISGGILNLVEMEEWNEFLLIMYSIMLRFSVRLLNVCGLGMIFSMFTTSSVTSPVHSTTFFSWILVYVQSISIYTEFWSSFIIIPLILHVIFYSKYHPYFLLFIKYSVKCNDCHFKFKINNVHHTGIDNEEWISRHAKKCPRCGCPTQKNGGCMHMKCSNCKYEYCWRCLNFWSMIHQCRPQNSTSISFLGHDMLTDFQLKKKRYVLCFLGS